MSNRAYTLEEKERIQDVVIGAAKRNINLLEAADLAGVDYSTIRRWRAQSSFFDKRLTEAQLEGRQRTVDRIENALVSQAADKGNVIAQIFALKNLKKSEYGETTRLQGPTNITVNIDRAQIALAAQTIEEMRKLESREDETGVELSANEADVWAVKQ